MSSSTEDAATIDIHIGASRPYIAWCYLFGRKFEAQHQLSRTTAAERLERIAKMVVRQSIEEFAARGLHLPEHAAHVKFRRHFEGADQ